MITDLTPAVVAIPMMDADEAREALGWMRVDIEHIDETIASFRQRALDFAEREGWRALGYANVADALNAELGTTYSKSYLSRLLGAARIERVLELPAGNSPPEKALRPLGQLDAPDQQRQAWQAASDAAGRTPTEREVQAAVDAIKPRPAAAAPAPKLATCARCGAERSPTRLLTTYGAGLVPEYGDRVVSLCSACIPELLAARRAAEQARPAAIDDGLADVRGAGDRAAYEAREAIDHDLLCSAERMISDGHFDAARVQLGRVQVATWRRDQLLAILVALESQQPAPPAPAPAPQACKTCGAPITNGHFGGQCGPCFRGEISAHPAAYPPAGTLLQLPADPRARAIVLLRAIEQVLPKLPRPESLEDLSVAISDLNECEEGSEPEYWLRVGWALIDMVPDDTTR